MQILYNSSEIRNAVKKLFTSSGEKIVIVGFVGADADYYLPNPKGVKIICWDKEGATNPDGIRALIKKGATVRFAKKLHMKLYYVKGRGAIITSANLSKNAFDDGNLKELGILIQSGKIDITKIIKSLNPKKCTNARLRELDKHLFDNPFKGNLSKKRQQISFPEWFKSQGRKKWKLGWADSESPISREAKTYARKHYNVKEPDNYNGCKKNDFKKGDWVLNFFLERKSKKKSFENAVASHLGWMYVDFIIPDSREKIYNYQAVEVKKRHNPPFELNGRFRKAFRVVFKTEKEWNPARIRVNNIINLSPAMLNSLKLNY